MKDQKIIDSWNKIVPDQDAQARMLNSILSHATKPKKKGVLFMNSFQFNWKRLAPIAACLVFAVALVGVLGNNAGWFGSKVLSTQVDGNTLNFRKANLFGSDSTIAFDFDVVSRELTPDEATILFGDMPITALATFHSQTGVLVHLEGKVGDTKVILATEGTAVTDTVIQGNENTSNISGTPVTAGYFVTGANSKGVKNIIYFTTFSLSDTTVYLELGGAEVDSDALRTEIANVTLKIIQNGAANLRDLSN
jgi:hypothetical protein